MSLRETYEALLNQSTDWIWQSVKNPNGFMSDSVIKLHYLVLRQRGEI
jgi:hypothetical protein